MRKRPRVDEFLRLVAQHYEVVIFTASLDKVFLFFLFFFLNSLYLFFLNQYANPLLDELDTFNVIRHRLFRESCTYYQGHYVKDLARLNRNLSDIIIVDNSAASYLFHPENAIDTISFIDDPQDFELDDIGRFLVHVKDCDDVRDVCPSWRTWCAQNQPNL